MRKVASILESLVGEVPSLEAIAAKAQGVTNNDLRALLERAPDPVIKARAAHVGGEADLSYFGVLMANAIKELKRVADLTDDEAEFPEFPEEGTDEFAAEDEPLTTTEEETFEEAPVVEEPITPAIEETTIMEPLPISEPVQQESVLAPNPEVTVDIHVDGEGVEVVHGDDDRLYVVLPESTVLSLHTASEEETRNILAKLNRSPKN